MPQSPRKADKPTRKKKPTTDTLAILKYLQQQMPDAPEVEMEEEEDLLEESKVKKKRKPKSSRYGTPPLR